jgi:hypothetical protein
MYDINVNKYLINLLCSKNNLQKNKYLIILLYITKMDTNHRNIDRGLYLKLLLQLIY